MSTRYHRVNIDGHSMFATETRIASEDLSPGTFAIINEDNEFEQATEVVGRLYVVDCAHHEGLGITDAVPAGHSAIGNYVEEGREMAVLVGAGTYRKDQPMSINSSGEMAPGSSNIIAYAQDTVTLSGPDLIRVRFRQQVEAPAVVSVTVTPPTASIAVAETVQLTAAIAPITANQGVTWTSSADGKATVSASGLVTGVEAGSATITATSTSDGTKTDTTVITVTA